ncbi:hypothetical protein [Streptomyces sp. NPDC058374]|uniref:hypothetical protein n=1 Tax=unclassified Streptomyces TaxID=2593676 RepID=UPI0036512BAF
MLNMPVWQPDEGETLLFRAQVGFATGEAIRVRGMRWFRDTERRDIQDDLPGWPVGPSYEVRTLRSAIGRQAPKVILMVAGLAVLFAIQAAGANVTGVGGSGGSNGADKPQERSDEVEDFPVMWAAPGTIARTLPWQLDPGRSKRKRYKTHLIVTDRRLLIVGLPFHRKDLEAVDDEVLWELPRDMVASVEPRDYRTGRDVKVLFIDGSWVRWESFTRKRLLRYADNSRKMIPLDSLPEQHRRSVEEFMADQPPESGPPIVTRNACGCYDVQVVSPTLVSSFFGSRQWDTTLAPGGEEQQDLHPDDFES